MSPELDDARKFRPIYSQQVCNPERWVDVPEGGLAENVPSSDVDDLGDVGVPYRYNGRGCRRALAPRVRCELRDLLIHVEQRYHAWLRGVRVGAVARRETCST